MRNVKARKPNCEYEAGLLKKRLDSSVVYSKFVLDLLGSMAERITGQRIFRWRCREKIGQETFNGT